MYRTDFVGASHRAQNYRVRERARARFVSPQNPLGVMCDANARTLEISLGNCIARLSGVPTAIAQAHTLSNAREHEYNWVAVSVSALLKAIV